MGLQLIAAAATGGARVLAVEPLAQRRELARQFGAEEVTTPAGWAEAAQAGGQGLKAILLSIGAVELVAQATKIVASGGRVVLFAGFGNTPNATLDLNDIHYREVSLVGSEWIGAPPNQRRERYAEALDLLRSGRAPFERLVEARCGLDELADAFEAQRALERLKTVVVP
jgi:S-(hydroxymethyl)glutathione dehydrogenase/alcohol dehydrogenase